MWLFLIILFVLGFLHTAVNLSLFKRVRYIAFFSFVLSAIIFCLFPFSVRWNIQRLDQLIGNFNTLSFVCTYQIIESIIFMLLSIVLIKNHHSGGQSPVSHLFSVSPSGVFLAGTFFLQAFAFTETSHYPFWLIALLLSLTLLIILSMTALIIRKLLSRGAWRIEIKIILSFLQIVLAMFLPLIVVGMKSSRTQLTVDVKATCIVFAIFLVIASIGYFREFHFETGGEVS